MKHGLIKKLHGLNKNSMVYYLLEGKLHGFNEKVHSLNEKLHGINGNLHGFNEKLHGLNGNLLGFKWKPPWFK